MVRLWAHGVAVSLAVTAWPCLAHDAPCPPNDTIVVTGQSEPPTIRHEDDQQAPELCGTERGREALNNIALARFKAPVCPGAN